MTITELVARYGRAAVGAGCAAWARTLYWHVYNLAESLEFAQSQLNLVGSAEDSPLNKEIVAAIANRARLRQEDTP